MPTYLTVDPGVSTGWCLFRLGKHRPEVLATGVVEGKKFGFEWKEKMQGVTLEFQKLLQSKKPAAVWLEKPGAFSSTSALSGSQGKLDACYGMLIGVCILEGIPWNEITVREWKGQLPKSVSTNRTRVALGMAMNGYRGSGSPLRGYPLPNFYPRSEHAWDALGLAVYVNNRKGKP